MEIIVTEEKYTNNKTNITYKLTYEAIKNIDETKKKELITNMELIEKTYGSDSPGFGFCGLSDGWVKQSINNCFAAVSLVASLEDGTNPEMIGLCTISIDGKGLCKGINNNACAEISAFCVSKKHRGSGTLLMDHVKSWLKSMKYNVITVSSLDDAIGFYIKAGFKTTEFDFDEYNVEFKDENDGNDSGADEDYNENERFFILDDNWKLRKSLM
jgi:GNAT superfamily N-acetyltransferase